MLARIDLRHFKCFKILKLPLRPLTLLSGVNASGKSSVMQALALLHQTMREHEWSSHLMLNGGVVRLGTVADVIDQVHGRGSCGIALADGEAAWFQWEFEGERDEMSMAVRRARGESGAGVGWDVDGTQPLHRLLPHAPPAPPAGLSLARRLCGLVYLAAERLGPREIYPLEDAYLAPTVDSAGTAVISVLRSGGDTPVLDGLAIQGAPSTLLRQVEARMERFFPGCELRITEVRNVNAMLGLRTSNATDFLRPVHMGFGLTQVLPVVTATLAAERDDLVLIENPEVHLHPAGQAAMGEFMAEAAAAGVQVLIETHSDHVLNGIRRAVKRGMLPPDDVALHFFRPRSEDPRDLPQVQSPILDANGAIDAWPEGFFDQFDKDMDDFAGWS